MDKRKKGQETDGRKAVESNQPLEDRALKLAAQFFGAELLPRLGISEKVRRIAPTEQVHLEMKDFLEDFNFEMENGVEVITYVICTVDVESPVMELEQGINCYRVQVIHLKEKDADRLECWRRNGGHNG